MFMDSIIAIASNPYSALSTHIASLVDFMSIVSIATIRHFTSIDSIVSLTVYTSIDSPTPTAPIIYSPLVFTRYFISLRNPCEYYGFK